ncbi:glycosyltransferase family 8 protein [Flavobacterium sp.]|uniref:glycosyltransferase family 8 protein n=1 Tax=Flavobacterium sp. TaxID=239 RepID=UPI003BD4E689
MNIAFNINRLALIGLGVTLNSLLKKCSNPKKLHFYILCADLNLNDKIKIENLLNEYGVSEVYLIDFDPKKLFKNYKSLQGDWTAYGRLLLQDYVKGDSVLYLDADLVIELDVLTLEGFDFKEKCLGAVNGGLIDYSLDNQFYYKIGLNKGLSVFNSGVLLFNLKVWREKDIKNKCLNFADKHPNELKSADQTILNGLFAGNFAYLPSEFNVAWYAQSKKPVTNLAILHFVGSPKPWDLFGRYFHGGYSVWVSYLDKDWRKSYYKTNCENLIRAWRIRRSYVRTFILKVKTIF